MASTLSIYNKQMLNNNIIASVNNQQHRSPSLAVRSRKISDTTGLSTSCEIKDAYFPGRKLHGVTSTPERKRSRFRKISAETPPSSIHRRRNNETSARSSENLQFLTPNWMVELKPGQVDCPCLLHCQKPKHDSYLTLKYNMPRDMQHLGENNCRNNEIDSKSFKPKKTFLKSVETQTEDLCQKKKSRGKCWCL